MKINLYLRETITVGMIILFFNYAKIYVKENKIVIFIKLFLGYGFRSFD